MFFDFDKRIKHYDLGINFCDDTSLSLLKFYQVRRKKNEIYRKRLEELIRKESPDVCISLFGKEFDFLPSLNISCKIIAELHFNKNSVKIHIYPCIREFYGDLLQKLEQGNWLKLP